MSNRLDQEREKEIQPQRIKHAKEALNQLGYLITFESETEIRFIHKGNTIHFFPYSGWHQGKGIKSGRGLNVLLNKLIP